MTTLSCFQPFIIHFTFLLLSFQSCILLKFVESAICWMSVSDLPVPMKSLRRLTSCTGSYLVWVNCTALCFHITETYLHCDKITLACSYEVLMLSTQLTIPVKDSIKFLEFLSWSKIICYGVVNSSKKRRKSQFSSQFTFRSFVQTKMIQYWYII